MESGSSVKLNSFFQYILISVFIILVDLIFPLSFIKQVSYWLVAPLNLGVERLSQNFKDKVEFIKNLSILNEENQKIEEEIARLNGRIVELKDVETENDFLRKQLEIQDEANFNLLMADVRGWQTNDFGRRLVINQGAEVGLKVGMPIIVENYLIGKLVEVGPKSSLVEIVTSARSSIPVMVYVGQEKVLAIADGEFGASIKLKQIPQDAQIKKGDLVLTSGKGGTFPEQLVLGKIEEVYQDPNEVYQQAKASPSTNLEKLDRVLVILETSF